MHKVLLAAALVCGCTSDPSSTDNSIAQVTLATGSTVTFYETSPGAIGIVQEYAIGEQPVQLTGQTAVAIFQAIAPGQAVPVELVNAQARALDARASRPASDGTTTSAPADFINNTTIDDKWFADTYCTAQGWQQMDCRLNQTARIGNSSLPLDISTGIEVADADEVYQVGCSDRGQETMWIMFLGAGDSYHWDLIQGHCVGYHWTSGWFNDHTKSGVENLQDNARYHFSVRGRH